LSSPGILPSLPYLLDSPVRMYYVVAIFTIVSYRRAASI